MTHPNIVLVSWDSARADHLPIYGYDRNTTPNLQSIAEQGVVFEDVHVPGVGTPTSFGGVFSGDYIDAVQGNYQADHWRTALADRTLLPEVLSEAGYYTGGIHANARLHREYGWNRGWDVYGDNLWTTSGDSTSEQRWADIKKDVLLPFVQRLGLGGQAIHARNILLKHEAYTPWESLWDDIEQFVREAPEPWFLWVLLIDSHHPWYAPTEYQEWDQPGFRMSHLYNYLMRFYPEYVGERHPGIVNAYDNELRHADAFLAALDDLLGETGNGDVPLVVHSDHGDDLGEHGRYGHDPKMYDTVTRVPLVMRNVGETGRVDGPTSLLDVSNTLLDIAGVDQRLGAGYDLFESRREAPVIVENFTHDDFMAAAVGPEWKVAYQPDSGWEAYHRPSDAFEQDDRYGEHPGSLERAVKRRRHERLPAHPSSRKEGDDGDIRDVREDLANLGYLE